MKGIRNVWNPDMSLCIRGTVTYIISIHDQNGPKDAESQYHDIRQNKGNGNILVDYQITLSFSSLLHLDGP